MRGGSPLLAPSRAHRHLTCPATRPRAYIPPHPSARWLLYPSAADVSPWAYGGATPPPQVFEEYLEDVAALSEELSLAQLPAAFQVVLPLSRAPRSGTAHRVLSAHAAPPAARRLPGDGAEGARAGGLRAGRRAALESDLWVVVPLPPAHVRWFPPPPPPALPCAQVVELLSTVLAAWSKWPSWWRHGWPPRAPQTAFDGLGPPFALVRRGPAPQIPPSDRDLPARGRPSRHFRCA